MWPTPGVPNGGQGLPREPVMRGNSIYNQAGKKVQLGLHDAVKMQNIQTAVGGQLNPDWVEWLMGVPIGWTSLDPLPQENYDAWELYATSSWWDEEPDIPRVAAGIPARIGRLKALGNGVVPAVVAAFLST